MVSIGEYWRFTTTITYQNATCKVVDYREIESVPTNPMTPAELAQSYGNQFVIDILALLNVSAVMTLVEADNLSDGITFGQWAFNDAGEITGDPMPSYVAIPIQLQRSTKVTRNGYKRLPGVTETLVSGNVLSIGSQEKLAAEIFFSGSRPFKDITVPTEEYSMNAIIVGRTKNASGVYELDLTRINPVSSASIGSNVTTQNTRKILA